MVTFIYFGFIFTFMEEIEVKILDIDREKVVSKLLSLGAKKIFEGELYAIFYDKNDGSVREEKNTLRLRKEGDEKVVVTYKKFVEHDKVKVRKEYEVEVSEFEMMKEILKQLDFVQWLEMRKNRISYKLGNVKFEFDKHIDQYSYVPEFMEIEAENVEDIYKYVELLGFTKEDCKPWTILDLAEHYM